MSREKGDIKEDLMSADNKESDGKKKKRIIIAIVSALLIALLSVGFFIYRDQFMAITMRIQRLVGTVNLYNEGHEQELREKMRLGAGQTVETAGESLIMVSLDDTKLMTMEESSKADIKARGKKLEFDLIEGNLFFNVTEKLKKRESFDIHTSTMICGIRGTSAYVGRDSTRHETLMVTDGVVSVDATNPVTKEKIHVDVYAGEKITIFLDEEAEGDATISIKKEKFREEDLPSLALDAIRKSPELQKRIAKATGFSTERLVALADATSKSGISMYGSAAEKLSADGIKDAIPIMGYNAQIMVRTANRAVDTAGDDLPLEIAIIKGLNGTMNSGIEAGYEGEPLGALVDSAADCMEACIKDARNAGLGNDDLVTVSDSVTGALQTSVGEMAKANLSISEITQVVNAIGTVYTEAIASGAVTGTDTEHTVASGSSGQKASTDNILTAVGNASNYITNTVDSEMLKKSTGEETAAELLRKARATESKAEESQTKADKTRQTAGNTDASANSQNTTANAPSATSSVNTQSSASAGTESTGTATSAPPQTTSSSGNSSSSSSSGSGNSGNNSGGNQNGGNSGSAPAVYGNMTIAGGITGGSVSTPLAAGSAPAQGETVTLNLVPNVGHSFNSLTVNTVDDNGNVTGSVNTTEVTAGSQYTFVMPTEKIVVNATFTPNTYNVNLNLNGATVTGGNITQYTYGTAVALPTQVTKASTAEFDYSFTGWTDAPTGGNPVTGITATDINDKNFYPQFSQTRRSYAVTKSTNVSNGYISVKVGTAEVTQAQNSGTVTVTVTPDTGYELASLTYTNAAGNATAITATNGVYSFVMPTEDITVNATFTQIAYNLTATFDSNKGNVRFKVGGNYVTSAHYTDVVVIELTPDTGYVSTRPSVNNGAVMEAYIDANTYRFDMPASDATVTETFDNASYTVSLDTHGGTINSGNVTSYTYGTGVTLPTDVTKAPTATTNYAFAGWFTEATGGTQVTAISTTDTGNKTYHAHWTETARSYNVTLNTAGGTINAGNVASYTYGTGATLPTNVTRTASNTTVYSFRGWFTAATGGTRVTSISTTDSGEKEFFAQWDESPREYNITPNAYTNGTLNIHIKNTTGAITRAANGATVVIDIAPNTNYRLKELHVRESGQIVDIATATTGDTSLEFTMPAHDVTVQAVFEENTYTISVNNTSGSGFTISSQTKGSFSGTSGPALAGETVTVTITRVSGHGPYSLSVDNQSVVMHLSNDNSTYTYQFIMPSRGVRIDMGSYSVSGHVNVNFASTMTHGSVSSNSSRIADGTIELNVNPDAGYELDTLTVTKVLPSNVSVDTSTYPMTIMPALKSNTTNVYQFTMPPFDVNVNATFKLATYTVSLNADGGTINAGNVTSYVYGTGATLPTDVTKASDAEYDYTFGGWYTEQNGSGTRVTAIGSDVSGNKTYYAYWTQVRRSYTVTKSATTNGSIAVKIGTTEVTSAANGATVTVVPTAATGYELDTLTYTPAGGSATAITATNGVYSFVMPTSNVTVTATFRVAGVSVTNVDITGQLINLYKIFVDDVYEIEADITPANATNKNVTWTSSNPSVASVTPDANNGLKATVTALTTGSTRITVRTQDGNKSDSVYLTIHNAPSGMFQVIETEDTANGTYTTVTIYNHHVPGSSWLGPYDDFNATPVNGGLSYQYLNGSSPNKIVIAEDLYPTSLEDAFYEMTDLDTIEGLNKVHTAGITSMSHMFYWCELLDGTLDLSSFDTSSVTDMTGMFDHCGNVDAIVVSNLFVVSQVTDSTDMFYSCYDLVGGAGTATGNSSDYFNITSNSDKTYARIDGGTSNPGYFTAASSSSTSSIYWAVTGTAGNQTLTFYNTAGTGRTAIAADASFDYGNTELKPWEQNGETIDHIAFAQEIRPTSLEGWFANMSGLASSSDITGISNLNTSGVTSMAGMFFGCINLTSLNLSSFDTSSVTTMEEMFNDCESLQTLNISGFDTSSVDHMDYMFDGCEALTEIDLSSFDTSSVYDMYGMFYGCSELTTIYATSSFVTSSLSSGRGDAMFTGCTNLRGGNGTAYSGSRVNQTYARIDATGTPGYFTLSGSSGGSGTASIDGTAWSAFDFTGATTFEKASSYTSGGTEIQTSSSTSPVYLWKTGTDAYWYSDATTTKLPEDCSYLFSGSEFTDIDLNGLDSSEVTNMAYMFFGCSDLNSVDFTGIDTSSVERMDNMFDGCSSLETVDLSGFDFSGLGTSVGAQQMFMDCSQLTTIYVSAGTDLTGCNVGESMFDGSGFIYGQNGTSNYVLWQSDSSCNIDYASGSLARVDSAVWVQKYDGKYHLQSGSPGYFSVRGATSPAANYEVLVNAATNGTVESDKTYSTSGGTVTLTITPDPNCEISSVTVQKADNTTVTVDNNGGTYSFTMPSAAVSVTVEFVAQ